MIKNGRKILFPILATCLLLTCGLGACERRGSEEAKEPSAFADTVVKEELSVKIPGMKGKKTLVYLSDLHLIKESDQIAKDQLETVRARMAWSSYDGTVAADSWPEWVDYVNGADADGVLFGGDMIDFASRANVDCLKKDLERLETPWIYVRADHDLAPSYLDGVFETESIGWQAELGGWCGERPGCSVTKEYAGAMIMEFDDFLIAGWNNSTAQLSAEGLDTMKEAFSKGKPVILLVHVPIRPLEDESLSEESGKTYGGRVLLWGKQGTDCAYQPNETTQEFLDMIYDENTPVCEILCGHLHLTWDGYVTPKVHQHVFGAALNRHAGIVTVSGQ